MSLLQARVGVAGQERTPDKWALYCVGLPATMMVVALVNGVAHCALSKRTTANS